MSSKKLTLNGKIPSKKYYTIKELEDADINDVPLYQLSIKKKLDREKFFECDDVDEAFERLEQVKQCGGYSEFLKKNNLD